MFSFPAVFNDSVPRSFEFVVHDKSDKHQAALSREKRVLAAPIADAGAIPGARITRMYHDGKGPDTFLLTWPPLLIESLKLS